MIFVERDTDPPADIARALSRKVRNAGKTELELARDYYSQVPRPKECYPFVRYKTAKVIAALDQLYKKKCAYCEDAYDALAAGNIEHYRPKGKVNECKHHDGYWWLAATWSNLLPSCIACNQLRTHTIFEPHMSLEDIAQMQFLAGTTSTGKGNAFPLNDDSRRVTTEGSTDTEDPLLINPSLRDPDDHLVWIFDREPGTYVWESRWILPRLVPRMKDGRKDPYGNASIGILGLNRLGLLRARVRIVEPLRLLARRLVESMLDLTTATTEQEAIFKQRINDSWTELVAYESQEQVFSAMNKAFIKLLRSEIIRMDVESNTSDS